MTIIALLIAFVSSLTPEQAQPEGLSWSFQQSSARNSRTVTFSATADGGLRRSFDAGKTWEQAGAGLTGSVVAIAAAPTAPALFYCATELEGIFRSDDYGLNWKAASAGLPVPLDHVTSAPLLAVDSSNSQWLYTVLTVPVHSHRSDTSLYRSSDGGQHWMLLKELPVGSDYKGMVMEVGRRVRIQRDGGDIVIRDHSETPDPSREAAAPAAIRDTVLAIPDSDSGSIKVDQDVDGVAVLEDDGTLLQRAFPLAQRAFEFRPTSSAAYDVLSATAVIAGNYIQDFITGAPLALPDDGSVSATLPFTFTFYGRQYTSVFVNSNGNISFGAGDSDSTESSVEFFARVPKIAPLWDDLNPETAGGIFTKADTDTFFITWNQVPEFGTTNRNTFQIILFSDGRIQFQYGAVAIADGLTGISNGSVLSGSYITYTDGMNLTGLSPAPIHEVFSTTPLNAPFITSRFYQTHDDDFDAVLVFGASELPINLAGPSATAFHATSRNDVRGIGRSVGDVSAAYGSNGRLQSYLNMNSLLLYPLDPRQRIGTNNDNTLTLLGQEWGHRFMAFARFRDGATASLALLGRDSSHWSYFMNSEASAVEGNEWRDNGDGSFTATDDTQRYGRLDHYLMGLRSASDVPDTLLLTNPEPVRTGTIEALESTFGRTNNTVRDSTGDFSNSRLFEFRMVIGTPTGPLTAANTAAVTSSGFTQSVFDARIINTGSDLTTLGAAAGKTYSITKLPDSTPRSHYFDSNTGLFTGPNVVFRATPRQVTMAEIIAQEGPRIPDVTRAQKNFRHAFILVVPKGRQPSTADLTKLANMRRAWESYYADATAGLGSISTSLAKQTTNELQSTISSNGGWAYTGSMRSSTVNVGYGILDPGAPGVSGVAVFTTRSGNQIVSEAGVAATGTVLGARFFVERTQSVNTGFAAIAPVGASTLTLELLNELGTVVATTTVAIPAGGHIAKFSHELFTNFTFPPSFVGSIRVTATTPVAVTVLRTIVNQLNEFLVTTLPIADSSVDTGTNPLYLAQVADSGGYQTELLLVNPTASAISGTAEFFRPDGTAFSLTVNGVTSAIVPYQISPNGSTVLRTSGTVGGQVNVGYLVVRPGAGTKAPIAGAVFSLTQNGLLVAATGVIPSASARRVRLFYDRNVGRDTGVAIVNLADSSANITFTLRNLVGNPGSPGTLRLNPRSHSSRFISEIVPSLPLGSRGVLEISSDVPIAVIALRSTQSGSRFLLSTLPVDDLDRLPPATVRYFPHTAFGGGYTTDFIILNQSTVVAPVRLILTSTP